MAPTNLVRPVRSDTAARLPRFVRRSFLPFAPIADAPLFHAWRP